MKYTVCGSALFVLLFGAAPTAYGQQGPSTVMQSTGQVDVSAKKAFALSLLVPGLGHRYAHGGDWDGWASVFTAADAGLWAGLLGMHWRRDHVIESYETLAVKHGGVDETGKERSFYLNVATYLSSDAFTEAQLRNRTWERIDYADDPSHQWEWDSEEHFLQFREMREDAESLGRRRSVLITSLVANRLLAGITALRAARKAEAPDAELSFGVPPRGSDVPLVRLTYRIR